MYNPAPPQHSRRYRARDSEQWQRATFATHVEASPLRQDVRSPRQYHYKKWREGGDVRDWRAYLGSPTAYGMMSMDMKDGGEGGGERGRTASPCSDGSQGKPSPAAGDHSTSESPPRVNRYLPEGCAARAAKRRERKLRAMRADASRSPSPRPRRPRDASSPNAHADAAARCDPHYARLRGWTLSAPGRGATRSPDSVDTVSRSTSGGAGAGEDDDEDVLNADDTPSPPPRVYRTAAHGVLEEITADDAPPPPAFSCSYGDTAPHRVRRVWAQSAEPDEVGGRGSARRGRAVHFNVPPATGVAQAPSHSPTRPPRNGSRAGSSPSPYAAANAAHAHAIPYRRTTKGKDGARQSSGKRGARRKKISTSPLPPGRECNGGGVGVAARNRPAKADRGRTMPSSEVVVHRGGGGNALAAPAAAPAAGSGEGLAALIDGVWARVLRERGETRPPGGSAALAVDPMTTATAPPRDDGPASEALRYQVMYTHTRGRLCRAAAAPLTYSESRAVREDLLARSQDRADPNLEPAAQHKHVGVRDVVESATHAGGIDEALITSRDPHPDTRGRGHGGRRKAMAEEARRPVLWGNGGCLEVLQLCLEMKDAAGVGLLDEILANCSFQSDRKALYTVFDASVVAGELYGRVYPHLSGVQLLVLVMYCGRPLRHITCECMREEISAAFTAPTPELCMKWARCIAMIITVTMWPLRPAVNGGLCVPSDSFRSSLEWIGLVEGEHICWQAPPMFLARQHAARKNSSAVPRLGFFMQNVDFGLAVGKLANVKNAVLLPPLLCFNVDSVCIEGIHADIRLSPLSPNPLEALRDRYLRDGWDAANWLRSECSEASLIHKVITANFFILSVPRVAVGGAAAIASNEQKLREALEADFKEREDAIIRSQTKPEHLRHLFYGF